jgi:hypothetical protein
MILDSFAPHGGMWLAEPGGKGAAGVTASMIGACRAHQSELIWPPVLR